MNRAELSLSDEAIERLVRLHSGGAGAAERMDFLRWRGLSMDHERAAREAEALWGALPETRHAEDYRRRVRRPRRWLALAAAACVAAIAITIALPEPLAGLYSDYATRTGERRMLELADGSRVWLNSDSALSVDFSPQQRRLRLHSGEALFEVAKDAARPFIVEARGGEVRAVGTRFDVDSRGPQVRVDVTEGVVQVNSAGSEPVRLSAGERLSYREAAAPEPVQPLDLSSASAWQRGKLIFNQRPLGEVLDELERYVPGRIVLTDNALRQHKVSGVFDLKDPDALLKTLERLQPVKVTHMPWLVLIRPAPKA
ncbi:FecR family protein [Pseudomonas nicosulfuronedens]|uniref:FecR family protein n=1 Tax=Pseudomonas nicosulfuronedens TaxID=2571105 RepID=A0A5R9RD47_9PSED|nr:FecR family protein [Pseudomonas nicosulfuronedens]MDH1009447.1 FecR family protein [Pseudomonas nicosulfuronedens]MDH1978604.1 FecR family protein [Pseudomonas nicosulfuronedens]MDH2026535.1 FecR family protein [Pseudomonas nicosulfuronedens]TLX81264.1 FecR family protein [Pseudomonas nicosulfuronedens]